MRINVLKDWLRDHTSWAPCGIEMKIKDILKSWFWISLHQGTLSILCSKIQGYMLSLMNEVYPCLLLSLCALYEMQNQIFQQLVLECLQYHACITCDWVFRIKENSFLGDLIFYSKIFYILVARVVWYRYMLGFINLLLNELIEHVSIYFVWDSEKRIIWNRFCFLHFAPTFILD